MAARNDPRGLLTILANADCPHCVHATDTLTDWCCEEGIPVAGLDITRYRELARQLQVQESPALVYRTAAGQQVYAGIPTHEEFLRLTAGL